MDKTHLLLAGTIMVEKFCHENGVPVPGVKLHEPADWRFSVCAYYRSSTIHICLPKCASIGTSGRQWSYPGYVVDRTPYGVLAHELGHHVDVLRGTDKKAYWSDFSAGMRRVSGEPATTGYAPNDAEWFAEIFRLWTTNPDLLCRIRPRVAGELDKLYKSPETRPWEEVLKDAPQRTVAAAERKVSFGDPSYKMYHQMTLL